LWRIRRNASGALSESQASVWGLSCDGANGGSYVKTEYILPLDKMLVGKGHESRAPLHFDVWLDNAKSFPEEIARLVPQSV